MVAIVLVVGKIPLVLTDSERPFTEMTAELGGGLGGAGGTTGGNPDPDPDEPPDFVPEPELLLLPELPDAGADPAPPAKGSLVSKRENDSS